MRDLFKGSPLFGFKFPVVGGGTCTFSFSVPFLVHLFIATTVTINLILWPIIGIMEAVRLF